MKNSTDISLRTWVVFALMCLIGIGILGRIIYIQTFESAKWTQVGENYTQQVRSISPSRGQIYSEGGHLLATSVPSYNIYWDSQSEGIKQDSLEKHLPAISELFAQTFKDRTNKEYYQLLKEAQRKELRYQLIQKNVDFLTRKALLKADFISLGANRSGFIFERVDIRKKPFGKLAGRTIGRDREGSRVGLELAYNEELAGIEGKQLQQRLAGNVWKPLSNDFIVEPKEGLDLITTIDVHLQDVASHALERQLKQHEATWGTVILMEVNTGYIKAISNLIRDPENGQYYETHNKAIAATVEPGSTFKLASIIAGLDDGMFSLTDSVDTGNGVEYFYNKPMKDSNYKSDGSGGHGKITMEEVFEQSSNIGTALAIREAYGMNPQAFLDKLHAMGLGQKLGIRIPGEGAPKIYKKEREGSWSGLSLTQMAIGYEVQQTPLQTLAFYNAIANGGTMLRPQFVKEIQNKGKVVQSFAPIVLKERICKDQTLGLARKMMEGVCEEGGTADYVFKSCKFKCAGKTGTAKISKTGGYYNNRYRASFCGYFPAENPKYSCIVLVNDTKTGVYYGSSIAAPVFRELADKIYATRYEMHQDNTPEINLAEAKLPTSMDGSWEDLNLVFSTLNIPTEGSIQSDWASISTKQDKVALGERKTTSGLVPNVKGMGLQDALYLLENAGLKVQVKGTGMVKSQSVLPGSRIPSNKLITIALS